MIKKTDFTDALNLMKGSKNVLITTHVRPDGDACGCAAALAEGLRGQGKDVRLLMLSEMPQWYGFLFDEKIPVLGKDLKVEDLKGGTLGEFDLVIIVDTDSNNQLPGFAEFLKVDKKKVLVIDHHLTGDKLGDVELIDTEAAAAGLIVLDLFEAGGWRQTESIAQALFVAITTDTGWFRFSNTDARTLRACAELVEKGAQPTELHRRLYENFSPARFKLMTAMLESLELHFDGRYAVQHLTLNDFARCGAHFSDTENLIDECQRIAGIEVAALLVELKDGRIKCSLRSKGAVDVREICQQFGGGGHKQAAGTYLEGPLERAKQVVFDKVREKLT